MKNFIYLIAAIILTNCAGKTNTNQTEEQTQAVEQDTVKSIIYEQEKNFAALKQITFGGDNAEGYWSFDDAKLIFQATNINWGAECDQIYVTDWKNDDLKENLPQLVSTGDGRTTCSYFLPGDSLILYASTHEHDAACPHKPEKGKDYVWPIYESFDIYIADLKGNIVKKLTNEPGYDAEATVSPKGDKIVFTSLRSGDLELYTMNIDGSDVKQITHDLGYDGGAFFSPDGTKLVFRASRPKTDEDVKKYKDLLNQGLVMPTNMEIFVCNVDGSDLKQVTNLGSANWCPYYHPSGEKIIFSSNHHNEKGFQFNLFMINEDGTGLEQITYDDVFDAFPVFSNNGKYLAFSSNRNNGGTWETNLFVAEWKD